MATAFSSLLTDYRTQLFGLTHRLLKCAPMGFLMAIPLVVISEVSFVLSFMLPLKIVILIGSDGVPRFLQFFMTQETKNAWVIFLGLLSIGFFLLHLASVKGVSGLGFRGGEAIREHTAKATLFDAEETFAQQVFVRTAEAWGTGLMVVGGLLLGLLLEWRLVILLLVAMIIEALILAWYWNRQQAPEKEESRRKFSDQRVTILKSLAGVNTLIVFGGLVVLFLTEPEMNFLTGLVMFILTRQILQRAVKSVQGGYFLVQQKDRIGPLVHPGHQIQDKRKASLVSFEALLMPADRYKIFEAIRQYAIGIDDWDDRQWRWQDWDLSGQALFVSPAPTPESQELRLKILSSADSAGLAREVMFYESQSCEALGLSAQMLATGKVHGRGFLLLASPVLYSCGPKVFAQLQSTIRERLWGLRVDSDLARRLTRSYPSLHLRLDIGRFNRIRAGCNDPTEESMLDAFLNALPSIRARVETLPKVLVNKNLSASNIRVTVEDAPIILNWDELSFDVIGSGLSTKDLDSKHPPEAIKRVLLKSRSLPIDRIDEQALRCVPQLTKLERLVNSGSYSGALKVLPLIMAGFKPLTRPAQGHSSSATSL